MNLNRHDKGAVVAGQSAGGRFAASLKTEADGGVLAETLRIDRVAEHVLVMVSSLEGGGVPVVIEDPSAYTFSQDSQSVHHRSNFRSVTDDEYEKYESYWNTKDDADHSEMEGITEEVATEELVAIQSSPAVAPQMRNASTAVEVAEKRLNALGQQVQLMKEAQNAAMVNFVSATAREIHPEAHMLLVERNDEWDDCYTLAEDGDGVSMLDSNGEAVELTDAQQGQLNDLLFSVNLDPDLTSGVDYTGDEETFTLALTDPSTPTGPKLMSAVGSDLNPDWVEVEARADDGTEATYLVPRDEYFTSAAAPFTVDPARHPTIAKPEENDDQ